MYFNSNPQMENKSPYAHHIYYSTIMTKEPTWLFLSPIT